MTGSRPQTGDAFAGNAFFFVIHFFVDRLKNAVLINIDRPSPRARAFSPNRYTPEPRVADAAMTTIIILIIILDIIIVITDRDEMYYNTRGGAN